MDGNNIETVRFADLGGDITVLLMKNSSLEAVKLFPPLPATTTYLSCSATWGDETGILLAAQSEVIDTGCTVPPIPLAFQVPPQGLKEPQSRIVFTVLSRLGFVLQANQGGFLVLEIGDFAIDTYFSWVNDYMSLATSMEEVGVAAPILHHWGGWILANELPCGGKLAMLSLFATEQAYDVLRSQLGKAPMENMFVAKGPIQELVLKP